MRKRALIVEDDPKLREEARSLLADAGFHVETAASLQEGRRADFDKIDIALCDWSLPDGEGLDLLRELRAQGRALPVIFVTGRSDAFDKVLALELGATDYVVKPFEPRELLARVKAQLRLAAGAQKTAEAISAGPLRVSVEERSAKWDGQEIELTKIEFDLLVAFLESPNRVFTREELLDRAWGRDAFPTERTVDAHVQSLRKKLPEDPIETVRGVGYRLAKRLRS